VAALREMLETLSNEFGPSGRERAVRTRLREMLEGKADRFEVDALGNLLAYKSGDAPEPRLRVLLAAHMDEVGVMVTRVEKSGLLRFESVGGLEARQLLAKRVLIGDGRLPGIIGAKPPHLQSDRDSEQTPKIDDLAIDVGADSDGALTGKVAAGDYGAFATRFSMLNEDPEWPTALGKAFDDRAGCTVLAALLEERYPVDLIGAFTVQEEVGLRGARVAAYRSAPDAAIILEGTVCDDLPRPEDEDETPVTRLGAGPAVTIMDRRHISHPGLLRLLRESAEAEGIPIQYKAPGIGGTDAGAVHLTREGIPAITVAVPCRYIHSPAAILNLNDLSETVHLVGAALRRLQADHLKRPE
jgi:endoglucanase